MAVATLRQNNLHRRFQERLKAQMDRERNGEPIHPELAARMTKPKPVNQLYQVVVDVKGERLPLRASPMMIKGACEMVLEQINKSIINGILKGWGNARIEPVMFAS